MELKKRINFFLFISLCCIHGISAQYPEIKTCNNSDHIYMQIQEDISAFYRAAAGNGEPPILQIFSYRIKETASLYSFASMINLPYETITTLNRLENRKELISGQLVLIPNIPGLFVPYSPKSDMERLLSTHIIPENVQEFDLTISSGSDKTDMVFIPGERFNKIERAFFLGILFRFPIPGGRITSPFGMRYSPITGDLHFHGGIDIAAPIGTEVLSAREGRVVFVGKDLILGNYIIIQHGKYYQTIYGHLNKILVELNQNVQSGMIVGTLGNTGMSTGPHLHFEIRNNGESRDPLKLVPKVSE